MCTLPHKFLHNHPAIEENLGLDKNHVIVDREDWEKAKNLLKRIVNLPKILEEKIGKELKFDSERPHSASSILAKEVLEDYVGKKFITSEPVRGTFVIKGELGDVSWQYHHSIDILLRKLYPIGVIDSIELSNDQINFRHTTRL